MVILLALAYTPVSNVVTLGYEGAVLMLPHNGGSLNSSLTVSVGYRF